MKRIQTISFLQFVLLLPSLCFAQSNPAPYLSDKAFNTYMNRTFGRLATGQDKTAELSNHASFGTNGNFTFNAFTPIRQKNEDKNRISYLSLKIAGGLLGENATTLFDDKHFNTNIGFDLSYHFQFPRKKESTPSPSDPKKTEEKTGTSIFLNNIQYLTGSREKYLEEVRLLEMEATRKKLDVDDKYSPTVVTLKIDLIDNSLSASTTYREAQVKLLNDNIKLVESLRVLLAGSTVPADVKTRSEQLEKLTEERTILTTKLDSVNGVIVKARFTKDSLTEVTTNLTKLARNKKQSIDAAVEDAKFKLQLDPKLLSVQLNWFSLIIGFENKSYYTYYDSLAFDSQIARHTLETVKIGLQWNYYRQHFRKNKVNYVNLGVVTQQDNNLKDLSTTDVSEETNTSGGNTKRKTTNKYSAYTDKIEEYQNTTFFLNYYLLFGSRFYTGIHFYPEWELRSTGKKLVNAGLGLIASFKNEAKGKPILNLEAFVKFKDLANVLQTQDAFYQRAQIGFRVGIPIQPL